MFPSRQLHVILHHIVHALFDELILVKDTVCTSSVDKTKADAPILGEAGTKQHARGRFFQ
jgi:hypothetical protein